MKGACFTLLSFEPTESQVCRRDGLTSYEVLSTDEMLDFIVAAGKQWEELRNSERCNGKRIENAVEELEVLFVHYTCEQEGVGITDEDKIRQIIRNYKNRKRSDVSEKWENGAYREAANLYKAYQMLKNLGQKEAKSDPETKGLLDLDSCVLRTHRRLMKGLSSKTRGGIFSTAIRQTTVGGELHQYPKFETFSEAEAAVLRILDRYNMLSFSIMQQEPRDEKAFIRSFFKCATWLFYKLISLHPFGDGNGRLCRLLLSYVIGVVTPFPVPLRDIRTSSRDTYLDAVVAPRKSDGRPKGLTSLLIESAYDSWKTFLSDMRRMDIVKAINVPWDEELMKRGLSMKTRGGMFSTAIRQMTVGGELCQYLKFETIGEAEAAVLRILDRYYMLSFSIMHQESHDEKAFTKSFFKCATWLFYKLISLHPFGDGNGRPGRLLLNYVISVVTRFPVPLCDVRTSSRDMYLDTVVVPGKSAGWPEDLLRLLFESMYDSLKTFLNDLRPIDVVKAINASPPLDEEPQKKPVQPRSRDGEKTVSCRSSELQRTGFPTDLQSGRSVVLAY